MNRFLKLRITSKSQRIVVKDYLESVGYVLSKIEQFYKSEVGDYIVIDYETGVFNTYLKSNPNLYAFMEKENLAEEITTDQALEIKKNYEWRAGGEKGESKITWTNGDEYVSVIHDRGAVTLVGLDVIREISREIGGF